jgi:cellobiose-specific phosphotransferase system component IIC
MFAICCYYLCISKVSGVYKLGVTSGMTECTLQPTPMHVNKLKAAMVRWTSGRHMFTARLIFVDATILYSSNVSLLSSRHL